MVFVCFFVLLNLLIRSGDTEWYESQAGGAGKRARETAGQEGAVQGTPAVSFFYWCSGASVTIQDSVLSG